MINNKNLQTVVELAKAKGFDPNIPITSSDDYYIYLCLASKWLRESHEIVVNAVKSRYSYYDPSVKRQNKYNYWSERFRYAADDINKSYSIFNTTEEYERILELAVYKALKFVEV